MPETSKNKWIAVVVALVIAAFFFGAVFFYSFNNKVNQDLVSNTSSATGTGMLSLEDNATEEQVTTNSIQTMNTTTTPEGLVIEERAEGNGPAAEAGQQVAVNYIGTLVNGTKFDSSYDRGQPIVFTLGTGQVIKGWDQGIAGMKVGGKRKLTIPAALAYGDQAVGGVIPANSTLVFEVELVGIK